MPILELFQTSAQFSDAACRGDFDVITVFADGALCHNPDHGETFDITFVAG
jgi:hypothetical protein